MAGNAPRRRFAYDVNVLEVICDYLSIQLVGMASSLRSRRTAELGRSLNLLRDELFTYLDDPVAAIARRCRPRSAICSTAIFALLSMTPVWIPTS
ncbi:MAG: hypothetical protein ACLU7D_00925 [Collinsella sp.]